MIYRTSTQCVLGLHGLLQGLQGKTKIKRKNKIKKCAHISIQALYAAISKTDQYFFAMNCEKNQ